uniref:Uncharacterized protein n=1 Tax=Trichuris muris TaxID=70415 RepID=A0A5S6QUQ9_TRIMR
MGTKLRVQWHPVLGKTRMDDKRGSSCERVSFRMLFPEVHEAQSRETTMCPSPRELGKLNEVCSIYKSRRHAKCKYLYMQLEGTLADERPCSVTIAHMKACWSCLLL